jgi:hypothetical protein
VTVVEVFDVDAGRPGGLRRRECELQGREEVVLQCLGEPSAVRAEPELLLGRLQRFIVRGSEVPVFLLLHPGPRRQPLGLLARVRELVAEHAEAGPRVWLKAPPGEEDVVAGGKRAGSVGPRLAPRRIAGVDANCAEIPAQERLQPIAQRGHEVLAGVGVAPGEGLGRRGNRIGDCIPDAIRFGLGMLGAEPAQHQPGAPRSIHRSEPPLHGLIADCPLQLDERVEQVARL